MMPTAETPLYNHPLPIIEQWLSDLGCTQDSEQLHFWTVERPNWKAELSLDVEELTVRYLDGAENGNDLIRSFKYSLSRQDVESAIFGGP